jgi:Flp pilus assembly protein TadG
MKTLRKWLRRDDGAFSPLIAVVAFSIFAMIGLSVDGGGAMQARERADNLAAEAARAGGQAIDLGQAVGGTADVVNSDAAVEAANEYLTSEGLKGKVTISPDRRRIKVVITITYQPVMLGLVSVKPWTETGQATAVLVTR